MQLTWFSAAVRLVLALLATPVAIGLRVATAPFESIAGPVAPLSTGALPSTEAPGARAPFVTLFSGTAAAFPPGVDCGASLADAKEHLERAFEPLRAGAAPEGPSPRTEIDAARSVDPQADPIVGGPSGRSTIARRAPRSVPERVLCHARDPVRIGW